MWPHPTNRRKTGNKQCPILKLKILKSLSGLKILLITFYCAVVLVLMAACRQAPKLHSASGPEKPAAFTVAILPYKNFDTALIPFIEQEVAAFYNCSTRVLPPAALPANAFYAPGQRYKADTLLQFQKRMAGSAATVLGLTDKDICTQKGKINNWGVFGLGYNPGKACVISTFRLKRASASLPQLKERLAKVVLHELGHNLGLPHCNYDSTCLMNDAKGTISQVDREQKKLCTGCQKLLTKE
jgi:archaemetzincin